MNIFSELGDASHQASSMSQFHNSLCTTRDDRALKTLARSISLSKHRFSLTFVRCDRAYPQSLALRLLRDRYNLAPEVLELPNNTQQLYSLVRKSQSACDADASFCLFILGLNNVTHLDELLISINQTRNEFQQNFSFPIVLWVNDDIIKKLIKLAPDFYNWASAPISLGYPSAEVLVF
ncbi:MAG: hypothetical protein AAGD25_01190 [Cyanobacteria bacterium P01_F01_bin.150]